LAHAFGDHPVVFDKQYAHGPRSDGSRCQHSSARTPLSVRSAFFAQHEGRFLYNERFCAAWQRDASATPAYGYRRGRTCGCLTGRTQCTTQVSRPRAAAVPPRNRPMHRSFSVVSVRSTVHDARLTFRHRTPPVDAHLPLRFCYFHR
ncbi:MAG TPA: hypothetical protein VNE00_07750, partial [Paraburkholderia sp.]|nr:hypothetical protein [Paraburkholderia sp.]